MIVISGILLNARRKVYRERDKEDNP